MLKPIVIIGGLFLFSVAYGAESGCEAQAMEKRLYGAAKTNFLKKCRKVTSGAMNAPCETQAAERLLEGTAKNSSLKKCESAATPGDSQDASAHATVEQSTAAPALNLDETSEAYIEWLINGDPPDRKK